MRKMMSPSQGWVEDLQHLACGLLLLAYAFIALVVVVAAWQWVRAKIRKRKCP
jgi:hypothetical protein